MCGHFAQFDSRDEFLAALAPDTTISSAVDRHVQYNIASAHQCRYFNIIIASCSSYWLTRAMRRHRCEQGKPPLINVRIEPPGTTEVSHVLETWQCAGIGIILVRMEKVVAESTLFYSWRQAPQIR